MADCGVLLFVVLNLACCALKMSRMPDLKLIRNRRAYSKPLMKTFFEKLKPIQPSNCT